jgi:hypothetical protein
MATLKQRIERIESELAELRNALKRDRAPDWRRTVEKFAGDEDLQAVFAEAMKLREADRKRARARRRGS